jgi:hypothetical protein
MSEYKNFFYAELIINWLFPFLFLMWNRVSSNPAAMLFVVLVLIIGQWIELYMSIMPNTIESHSISWIEVGTFMGYLGIFVTVVVWSLKRITLVPKKHPYLIESIKDH